MDKPEYINALMENFRELIIGLEDEGDRFREKLDKLRQRTRNTQIRIRHSQQHQQQAIPNISTSTIPTDSTPPPTSDSTDFPAQTRRSATLPPPQLPSKGPSYPPVRPPRQNDLLRKNLDEICNRIYRQQLARERRSHPLTGRSQTMTSAAMNAAKTRGALIVLEGVDRVGKSTLAKKLVEHLERLRRPVAHVRFPDRSTPVGHLIDEYLRSSSKQIDDHVMHLLFSANRWELSKRIRNNLNQGISVIVDRYSYSGIAYSSAKSSLPLKWCCEMERGLPSPDLVIYLELRREVQHKRDGFGDERFETKEMQDLVRLRYEQVMELSKETWLKVDVENKKPDEVLAEVILPVKRCLEAAAIKDLEPLDFFPTNS